MAERSRPPIGAISAGIRYQVRFFWLQALPMLYKDDIAKVVVEHRNVDVVDDVVVYYSPPGIIDEGTKVSADFYQVKYHVSQGGSVNHDSLIDPKWIGTKESLLKRFCGTWKQIGSVAQFARLNLVTNWAWNPACPLAPLIRDGGFLNEKFLTAGPRTIVGKIRSNWMTVCGLGKDDFSDFVRALRFYTSSVSLNTAKEMLNDRCGLAGLVSIDTAHNWSPYDDLGKYLIESGQTEHTRKTLLKLLREQDLIQDTTPLFRSTFAIRSFRRFAHIPIMDGACVVDLTDLFDNRWPIIEDTWRGEVSFRLKNALPNLEKLIQPVQVALDVHLSIAWYVGRLLNSKSGISVLLPQHIKGKGIELWDISKPRLQRGAAKWKSSVEKLHKGQDIALVISVTHSALTDAKRHIAASLPSVGSIVHFELSILGPASVLDGGHARWLVDNLVREVELYVSKYRPSTIHLFPACPASLMFLIGQEADALGPAVVYEFGFGEAGRNYFIGMSSGQE
jgi:hypothetical protein